MTGKRPDLYVRNGTVVTESGTFYGGFTVLDGIVDQWISENPDVACEASIDACGLPILPGLVDGHVHFSEPGREHWEGFETGARAAAAGGVTTVVEMPLNASPPTIDVQALNAKRDIAEKKSIVDFALWGGLVNNNLEHLPVLHEAGVAGFKAFLCESATDFKRIDDDLLYEGLRITAELGSFVAVHAENEWITQHLANQLQTAGRIDRKAWGEARPLSVELEAIQRSLFWAKQTGGELHIVHCSQSAGVDSVSRARDEGVSVTVETCPHYLYFTEQDFEHIGPAAKCAPPLRAQYELDALWERVLAGKVDIIGSDHSPCTWEEKSAGEDNVWRAWGGISGLQSTLSVLLTEGVKRRGLELIDLVRITSANPARRFSLYPKKGSLMPGSDADFIIVDPDVSYSLTPEMLAYKHPHSAYVGETLFGAVKSTYVRGQLAYQYDSQSTNIQDHFFADIGLGSFQKPS